MTVVRGPRGADESLDQAVELVRRLPIRWAGRDAGGNEDDVTARGWFEGADECARILASCTDLEVFDGHGFGGDWPLVGGTGSVIAPALPVVMADAPVLGVDGEYGSDATGVWREAVGVRQHFLVTDASQPTPGAPFDLLWFGEDARFLIRDQALEIDDLFGRLRVPATRSLLNVMLVRRRRLESSVLESLHLALKDGPQVIEVRRPAGLTADERWRDARRFLAARSDVENVRRHGASLRARLVDGLAVTFGLEDRPTGWRLTLRAGDYALSDIRLDHASNTLNLSAVLDPRVDALAPGMRGRLIFDLRSDLVMLG